MQIESDSPNSPNFFTVQWLLILSLMYIITMIYIATLTVIPL